MKLTFHLHAGNDVLAGEIDINELPSPRVSHGRLTAQTRGASEEVDWAEISPGTYSILRGGRSWDVRVERQPGASAVDGAEYLATAGGRAYRLTLLDPRRRRRAQASGAQKGPQEIMAPMPGRIVKVLAAENSEVQLGAGLLVMEAMKMQNEIRAPRAGLVEKIYVQEGQGVETGAPLIRLV